MIFGRSIVLTSMSKFVLLALLVAALLVLALGGWAVRAVRPATAS
jgi:hypothetical protein